MLSSAFARQIATDAPSGAPPPRRRSHGTAEIARRVTGAGARVLAAVTTDLEDLTQPVAVGHGRVAHSLAPAWVALPIIMLVTATLAFFARIAH